MDPIGKSWIGLGLTLLLACASTGCIWVLTQSTPKENRGFHQLKRERKIFPCWRAVDRRSFWIWRREVWCLQTEAPGRPEGSLKDPPAIGGTYYPKGTPVRIRKIRYVVGEEIAILEIGKGKHTIRAYAAFPDVLNVLERPGSSAPPATP